MSSSPLSADEVERFYADRGIKPHCEVCNKNDWHVLDKMTEVTGPQGFVRTLVIPGSTLICKNCGNARFHAKTVYETWRKQKNDRTS